MQEPNVRFTITHAHRATCCHRATLLVKAASGEEVRYEAAELVQAEEVSNEVVSGVPVRPRDRFPTWLKISLSLVIVKLVQIFPRSD